MGEAGDPDLGVELLWGERPALNLARIVGAAVAVADEEGLAGLSMRKVAERLGFTTMSLYRHVPGRDHLVDLMCDAVLGELPGDGVGEGGARAAEIGGGERPEGGPLGGEPAGGGSGGGEPDGGLEGEGPQAGRSDGGPGHPGHPGHPSHPGGWRAGLEAFARRGWEVRRRHPWLAEVPVNRRVPGPNALAHYEHALGILAGTDLAPAEVVASVGLLSRFLDAEARALADAVRAERSTGVGDDEWWGARDSLFARFDRYPVLTGLWEAGGFDQPESFEFGLARVLDGIELLVEKRDVKRDETCQVCGGPVVQPASGRPRAYCSRACQQRAYRKRRPGPADR
ncbi:TetR/AcrR family transcriptional regulator [Saccharothrix xinjiangensis]|uniref:TetR/AcrR family transcriptional regulator n=1 Tax=Saccharothrix xinjiangensis TaxID=204798 RepID=A0ABV9Y0E8_9PSEU